MCHYNNKIHKHKDMGLIKILNKLYWKIDTYKEANK